MAAKQKKPVIDRDNPALGFLSIGSQEENTAAPEREDPEVKEWQREAFAAGYRLIPIDGKPEAKTKRVQLVMRPSLYEEAKAIADIKNLSFNEYINRIVEEAVVREK